MTYAVTCQSVEYEFPQVISLLAGFASKHACGAKQ